jgi:hypothetical protein
VRGLGRLLVVVTTAAGSPCELDAPTANDDCKCGSWRNRCTYHNHAVCRIIELSRAASGRRGQPGLLLNVYYLREPSNMSNPEQATADVRMKDGTNASQIASIDPGQPVHQFQFPGIDRAAVQEVLLTKQHGPVLRRRPERKLVPGSLVRADRLKARLAASWASCGKPVK